MPEKNETVLLEALNAEDDAARNKLFEGLYAALRRQAESYMSRQPASHTLQPTALVHEAFVKLFRSDPKVWKSREHFMAVAARTMMSVLVDYARARGRKKRKAPGARVPLDAVLVHFQEQAIDVIDLQEKLESLARLGPDERRASSVVELRAFAGLTMEEIAHYLTTPKRTVERDFRFAKAWLHRELGMGARER